MTFMPYFNNGPCYFHPDTNSFSLLPSPNIIMTPNYLDTYNTFQNYSSLQSRINFNNSRRGTQRKYRNRVNLTQINNHVPKLTEDLGSSSSVKSAFKIPPVEARLPNNADISKGDKISFISPNAENVMDPETDEFCSRSLDDSITILAVDPPKEEKEKIIITLSDTEDNGDSELSKVCTSKAEQSQSIYVRDKENISCSKKKKKNKSKVCSSKAERSESISVKDKVKTFYLKKKKKRRKKVMCENNIQKVNSSIQDEVKIVISVSDSEGIDDSEQSNVCSTKANVSENIVVKKREKSSQLKKKLKEKKLKNKKIILPRKSQGNSSLKTVTKKSKSALKKFKEKNKEVSLQEVNLSCQKDFSEEENISVNSPDAENVINLEKSQFNSKNANNLVMNPEVNLSNQDENIIVALSDTEDIADSKLPSVCPSVVKGSANVGVKHKKIKRTRKKNKNETTNKENIIQNKSQKELGLKKVNKKSKGIKKLKEKVKKKKALGRNLKLLHNLSVRYRRPVVIDGSNVAITHGLPSHTFSAKGIQLCVDFFLKRGHTQITAFVPMFRMNDCSDHPFPTVGQEILKDLAGMQHVVFTPSRDVNGKHINSYDDRFIVELASKNGGIIVSNDNYKDLIHESESFRETIENRLLMFVFVGDLFMVPDDPLGRQGPKLEEFLHF